MIRIYIVLTLLALLVFLLRGFPSTPAAVIKNRFKQIIWLAAIAVVLVMLISGKLNSLFAILGLALAFLVRYIPIILRYAPQLHKLWQMFGQKNTSQTAATSHKMSRTEAFKVLGLAADATEADIILAHRKLISRIHPDKGGSAYLAAQINLAKQILIPH